MPGQIANMRDTGEGEDEDNELGYEGDGHEDADEDIMLLGTTPQVFLEIPL